MSNRLLNESSPYLRQHAHNPVDWYPWGSEAFSRARSLNRPILLSVGYSACHWCHVMEHESFDNLETAELMNAHFVCVKVDREERPDVDHTYQRVVQLMGRSGGWPLTVFLTPALEPFYAGTYFPPVERYGMPSFRTVLHALHDAYTNRSSEVSESAREITEALRTLTEASGEPVDPPKEFLIGAAEKLARRMDPLNGGFGSAPKFPNTMNLDVLLLASRGGHSEYAERVMTTLRYMRAGGIYDQLGGGFHRYSTDAEWLVPHFEKMLYDNALLARVFTDAAILTGDATFAETVRDTLRYVEREMTSPDGAFYSTQDADSEGEEGKFFVWTPPELASELGADDARIARVVFTVPEGGNFEHGTSILTRHVSDADAARELGLSPELVRESMSRVREKLFHAREQREKPFRDEKILATWNGLMISAFAHAGGSFADAHFVEVAARALEFVREHLWSTGNLLRVSKDGVAKIDAFLDDYADMANAALDVHQATLDERALVFANALVEAALAHFWDEASQTFYYTRAQQPDTLMRISDVYDHAVPSGVSSICHALLRLHALTDDVRFLECAEVTLRRYSESALSNPFGFGNLLCAMARYMEGPTEIVVVGDRNRADTQELLAAARSEYVPFRSISCVAPGGAGARTGIPTHQHDGRATAYVCVNRACSLPIVSEEQLRANLRSAAVSSPN